MTEKELLHEIWKQNWEHLPAEERIPAIGAHVTIDHESARTYLKHFYHEDVQRFQDHITESINVFMKKTHFEWTGKGLSVNREYKGRTL